MVIDKVVKPGRVEKLEENNGAGKLLKAGWQLPEGRPEKPSVPGLARIVQSVPR